MLETSYNSPTNEPTVTQLGCSHPITFSTCPPWCGGRYLATAHCTFSSHGRLEAQHVNQFCWNLVHNSKLGPQWQSHDQILKFLKFKMADGHHVGKYSKCHNSPTNGPTVTQLGWSHPIMFSTCPPWCGLRLPRQRPLPSNGALNILQLWASGGRTREPILMKFGTQQHLRTTMTVTWSNIEIYKIQNDGRPRHVGKYWKYHNSPTNGPIGTKLGWPHPITFPTCPP